MFNLTKKKVVIILLIVVAYTIVGALILSNLSQTRDATQEEIAYYQQFVTDWKAIPGVDTSLSEKDIILSMCVLKVPATTGTTQTTTATDVTQTVAPTDATQATESDTSEYTSELLPKYLFRYKDNLAVDVKDDVVIFAYLDEENHYVLATYDENGINELVVHNQKDDVAYFQKEGAAQVVTGFSYSIYMKGYYS